MVYSYQRVPFLVFFTSLLHFLGPENDGLIYGVTPAAFARARLVILIFEYGWKGGVEWV